MWTFFLKWAKNSFSVFKLYKRITRKLQYMYLEKNCQLFYKSDDHTDKKKMIFFQSRDISFGFIQLLGTPLILLKAQWITNGLYWKYENMVNIEKQWIRNVN